MMNSIESFKEQRILLFDFRKCSGCFICMLVCSYTHYGGFDFNKSHIRVYENPKAPLSFISMYCTHCDHPICEAACPANPKAIVKSSDTGFVKIDRMKCIGCRSCICACPISIPHFDEEYGVCSKCDACDGKFLCAEFCSTGALMVVPRSKAKYYLENIMGVKYE
ncbi:MAG: 4Fe-4S dicluster domain-containing protein [Candidatus Methanomethylicia archaeon]